MADVQRSYQETKSALLAKFKRLQEHTGNKASIPRCIATVQKIPCLFRCDHDLRQPVIDYAAIDPLYSAKHEFAKIKFIDAISGKLPSNIMVKCEYDGGLGRLDIALLVEASTARGPKHKTVGIEIKTCKTIDIFQIERYLYECDLLVIARIVNCDVSFIKNFQSSKESRYYVDSMIEKIAAILEGNLRKIEGEWCRGCSAACELRKSNFSNNKLGSIAETNDLLVNLPTTIRKTITILQEAEVINSTHQTDHESSSSHQKGDANDIKTEKPP